MQLSLWKCQNLIFTLLWNLKEGTFFLLGFCISILLSLLRPSLLLQFEFGLSGKKKRSRWLRNGSLIAIVFASFFQWNNIFGIDRTTVTQRNVLCSWLRVMDSHMTTSLFLFWTMHHQLVYMATKKQQYHIPRWIRTTGQHHSKCKYLPQVSSQCGSRRASWSDLINCQTGNLSNYLHK